MTIWFGPQMIAGLKAPPIQTILVPSGVYQRGDTEVAISSFELGVTQVTNQQYGFLRKQLKSARFFAMATDPKTKKPMLIARGSSRNELEELTASALFKGLKDAKGDLLARDLLIFQGGYKVFEVEKHEPPRGFDRPGQPAVTVSWYGAFVFADLLRSITGKDYGLPTEFQYELPARGPAGRTFATSTGEMKPAVAHYRYNDTVTAPADVNDRRYPTMENGFRHMAGNVAEWMLNWAGDFPQVTRLVDPLGPDTGEERILRMGSFEDNLPEFLKIGFMGHYPPYYRHRTIGFRVARNLDP